MWVLTSFHKNLRFCDLCKELAFGAPEVVRPNRDFIQLVCAQHVVPPVPGEAKVFALDIPLCLRFGLWLGARKNLGPWVLLWQAALAGCSGRLPSRIREAGINGLLPAARVPSNL